MYHRAWRAHRESRTTHACGRSATPCTDEERELSDSTITATDGTTTTARDRFGAFGGRYVPETLIPAIDALEHAFDDAMADSAFRSALDDMLRDYVGRPSILSDAPRLSAQVGAQVFLKREDLNHTGAHKINNTVGQVLLARRMG